MLTPDSTQARRLTVRLEIIEGDYDPTDPIDRIAPRGAKVAILQALEDRIEGGHWHVWGGDADRTFNGWGPTQYARASTVGGPDPGHPTMTERTRP
jgi:hypothetical protein